MPAISALKAKGSTRKSKCRLHSYMLATLSVSISALMLASSNAHRGPIIWWGLAAARDAEIASLIHDLPELMKDAEAVREKHASVQAALADELVKAIAVGKITSH
jgi:hypothetical protein